MFGDEEIATNLAKNVTVPRLEHCRNQTARHVKTGKYFIEREIIALRYGENHASLSLRILEEAFRTTCTSLI